MEHEEAVDCECVDEKKHPPPTYANPDCRRCDGSGWVVAVMWTSEDRP